MKNKLTFYLFMLTFIGINCLIVPALIARTGNLIHEKTLSATITGDIRVCEGTVDVAYRTEGGMTNYHWYVSDGGVITSGEGTYLITVTWKISGIQSVSVGYHNILDPGLAISANLPVEVDALPADAGEMNGPTRVCQGDQEELYSVPPISGASDYVWLIPSGSTIISGANTNSIKVAFSPTAASGNVAVYGTNNCGDGTVSGFYPVAVHPIPATPIIITSGYLLHSSAPEGNVWYQNGNIIPGATRQDYLVTQSGQYWSVVSLGGCVSDPSNITTIDIVLTGCKDLEESVFQMYPVPNDGQFYIRCRDKEKSNVNIQVYNSLGSLVYEKNEIQLDANSTCFIDLQSISRGTYAVVIQKGNYQVMKKMLITK